MNSGTSDPQKDRFTFAEYLLDFFIQVHGTFLETMQIHVVRFVARVIIIRFFPFLMSSDFLDAGVESQVGSLENRLRRPLSPESSLLVHAELFALFLCIEYLKNVLERLDKNQFM